MSYAPHHAESDDPDTEQGKKSGLTAKIEEIEQQIKKQFDKFLDGIELILHSDQVWQYQHQKYQRMLKEKGIQ